MAKGNVRVVQDVVSPAVVAVVDIGTEHFMPDYNEPASYIMLAAGYGGALLGYGGDFVKNMGIASFDWAAKNLYERIKTWTGGTSSRASAGAAGAAAARRAAAAARGNAAGVSSNSVRAYNYQLDKLDIV